jgi:ketosteroid isomerase-like protein
MAGAALRHVRENLAAGLFGAVGEGAHHAQPHRVVEGGQHGLDGQCFAGRRAVLDEHLATVCTLRDGRIVAIETYLSDLDGMNAFFARD